MQIHEWEKQEKLLEKIEQFQIEDCMQYNKFAYEKHEWDNIPTIVPRYVIYLSKYVEGISQFCMEVRERETTKDLRDHMTQQLVKTTSLIQNNKDNDSQDKQMLNDTIEKMQDHAKEHKNDYHKFKESATALNDE